jgi:hypothetical protein
MKIRDMAFIGAVALNIAAIGLAFAALADPAHAAGKVKIIGGLEINADVGNVTNIAKGKNSRAGVSIGTVHGGKTVIGVHKETIRVKSVVNQADPGTSSCIHIGTLGKNPVCD